MCVCTASDLCECCLYVGDNADTAPIRLGPISLIYQHIASLMTLSAMMSILLLFVVSGANGATLARPTLALTSAEA